MSKKATQAAVLVAGVACNALFAWFLFTIVLLAGIPASVHGDHLFGEVRDPVVTIVGVVSGSPAEAAGLQVGDTVVSLVAGSDKLVPSEAAEVAGFVENHSKTPVIITYQRGGVASSVTATPTENLIEEEPSRAVLGIGTDDVGELSIPFYVAPIEAARMTAVMTWDVAKGIVGFVARALTFRADLSQVAGPVGIVGLVGDVSALGLIPLLTFTAFISINLAVINLLPFPALDGGRLLFVAIETVKGSRISPRVASGLNVIGFAFLILLMLVVTYHDLLKVVG